jgi:NAD(P)-dependent dehydrogenase (short-subunit alcohol dehydrogenase family)
VVIDELLATDSFEINPKLKVLDVNTNGVLFTAQAAGRQMSRFGRGGSIILIASMSGSITNRVRISHKLLWPSLYADPV